MSDHFGGYRDEAVAAATAALPELDRLRGKRLLLTGGTGFIGRWLLEHLAHLNDRWGDEACRVVIPTRAPAVFAQKARRLWERPEFTFIQGDVRAFMPPDQPCDYIVHAAASASPLTKEQSPVDVGGTIVDGTRRILEMAHGWRVQGMLFLSSGAVYGVQPRDLERVPEEFTGAPSVSVADATYGEGKRYAEALCVAFQTTHDVPVTIARPFTFMAPFLNLDAGFASTDFLRDALRGGPLEIKSDGTTVRSFASATSMLSMLWATLLRGAPGRAYNVGSDEPVSVLELAQVVARACDPEPAIHVAQQPTPGRLPARYLPDTTRMREELGLRTVDDLALLVRETLRWARESQRGERADGAP